MLSFSFHTRHLLQFLFTSGLCRFPSIFGRFLKSTIFSSFFDFFLLIGRSWATSFFFFSLFLYRLFQLLFFLFFLLVSVHFLVCRCTFSYFESKLLPLILLWICFQIPVHFRLFSLSCPFDLNSILFAFFFHFFFTLLYSFETAQSVFSSINHNHSSPSFSFSLLLFLLLVQLHFVFISFHLLVTLFVIQIKKTLSIFFHYKHHHQ